MIKGFADFVAKFLSSFKQPAVHQVVLYLHSTRNICNMMDCESLLHNLQSSSGKFLPELKKELVKTHKVEAKMLRMFITCSAQKIARCFSSKTLHHDAWLFLETPAEVPQADLYINVSDLSGNILLSSPLTSDSKKTPDKIPYYTAFGSAAAAGDWQEEFELHESHGELQYFYQQHQADQVNSRSASSTVTCTEPILLPAGARKE